MPARTDPMLRVARATYDEVQRVAKKVPQFTATSLADTLLREACAAMIGGHDVLPTVSYIRGVLGVPPASGALDVESRVAALERMLASHEPPQLMVAESPEKSTVTTAARTVRYGKKKSA